ncbi:DNA mismatch repair endonuclease MutL [Allocoleopsis franciscana]|uniref:DNA mismatch repair protein MutL n=1 Tax=Allocoleopsis franciscana PCC 7113 TaxID=1173027 RepID=K9WBE5_9CYAN|nr:DNA mismatch repair endonuclease MutL [Allocoleopsis franciscana]AFZ17121.1 DNA mismatch repair protein MutL [Allocoleopsis franciscana PCC 7113]
MSFGIRALPKEVVNLIAAGEVIDSLAAVVRELVENALDAGATRIAVSVWSEQWRVRVADNGMGMDLGDLQQAATAHSTSKIRTSDDLWKITSLGFRGEALHSLVALADLEILSRQTPNLEGWRVRYNSEGEPAQVDACAIAPGTVVTVSNLFGNWPVRRKGLPSVAQQLKAIQTTIQQIALCHPRVTWQVQQNERPWFSLSAGITTQHILPQILRQVRQTDLQYLCVEIPTPETGGGEDFPGQNPVSKIPNSLIQIVLGLPDRCHRRRPDWVKVATNRRLVRSPELEQTILAATSRTCPRDRYPICFLHLQICPSLIDWNRHPAKAEIYLHSLSYWQEQASRAIEQALRISPTQASEANQSQRVTTLLKVSEEKAGYNVSRSIQPTSEEAEKTQKSGEIGLIELRAVAQVHNMYIVAEHPTGMWLVEQHIAHERVLYEQLCDRWQLVPLEPPAILSHLTPAQVEQLQRLGLEIEPFGEQLWAVRNAPDLLTKREDCAAALLELSLGGDLQTAQVATACRSAIRNGTPLSLHQMQTLLDQWTRTRHPRTCPHGRPIYLALEESSLARFFRRHWVIGKSHGI